MTNAFAVLGLLSAGDRGKGTGILVLRDQIAVLERQLGEQVVRFALIDWAFLVALLRCLTSEVLCRMRLLVRSDTVLRWHRDLIAG